VYHIVMKLILKIFGVVLLLSIIGVATFGYSFYSSRTYVPQVTLPAQHEQEDVGTIEVESVTEGVGQLWGLDFIPGTALLVATQRQGKLFVIDTVSSAVTEIMNVPTVTTEGQGGLLDVAVSPDFINDQTIFLTYAAAGQNGSATHVARAKLMVEAQTLDGLEVLYQAPFQSGGAHFGSRVVVDGPYIYVTLGDRGDKNFENHISQNTLNPYGSIIRLYHDGSIPTDNPFVADPRVLDEIYSYGHRNPQGLVLRPRTNELWSSEHGEFQGDEINIISPGGNYGWPEVHDACSYVTRRPFGVRPSERPDTIAPVFSWVCGEAGFPPAGMTFYEGDMFPMWQGNLFVGGLASRSLAHFLVTDEGLVEQPALLQVEGWRVRDVIVGPHDGALYVAVEGANVSLVRIKKVLP